MNQREQVKFIHELVDAVEHEILMKVTNGQIPVDWDGVELRWYIADKFSNIVMKGIGSKKRKQNYNNTIYTSNL
jgi:hypothetical protein